MSNVRRLATATISALALLAVFAPAAAAAPPGGTVTPQECIQQWDNNPNYVGEGWVGAFVASAVDVNGVTNNLFCGDELSGVIHIASSDSTGQVHPIAPEDDDFFIGCFENVIEYGVISPGGTGRARFDFTNTLSNVPAGAFVDVDRKFTYTVFANGNPASNNWFRCVLRG